MKYIGLVSLVLALSAASGAQSINSFVQVESISGISTTLSGLNLSVNLGGSPSFTWNSATYQIERVWGVWALDDNDDMTGSTADQGLWKTNENFASFGGILGWKTQTPNQGLVAGQSVNLAFSSLAGTVEDFGYHVRVVGNLPGGSNTMHIRQSPVPEPATMAVLGLGLLPLLRRRSRA